MVQVAGKFATMDAYIAALPEGPRAIMGEVRDRMRSLVPGAEEAIRYDMPAWRLNGQTIIHIAAWKQHLGLYPVYRGDADFEAQLAPYRDKTDTVKFPYTQPIPYAVIAAIVQQQLARLEQKA